MAGALQMPPTVEVHANAFRSRRCEQVKLREIIAICWSGMSDVMLLRVVEAQPLWCWKGTRKVVNGMCA